MFLWRCLLTQLSRLGLSSRCIFLDFLFEVLKAFELLNRLNLVLFLPVLVVQLESLLEILAVVFVVLPLKMSELLVTHQMNHLVKILPHES